MEAINGILMGVYAVVYVQLICIFVFAYAKSQFSHDAPQLKI